MTSDTYALPAMDINEAMKIARECACAEYPPINRSALVRAMSAIQSASASGNNFTSREYDKLAISVQVIAAWMLVREGYTDLTTLKRASSLWLNLVDGKRMED